MTRKCPKTCKTKFPSQKKADRAKMRIWSHDPQANIFDLHSYLCPDCGAWHVGHKSYFLKSIAKQDEAVLDVPG